MTRAKKEAGEIRRGRPPGPRPGYVRPANAVEGQQYDRMRAPVWNPPAAAPIRAGALNFKRIESRGYRC